MTFEPCDATKYWETRVATSVHTGTKFWITRRSHEFEVEWQRPDAERYLCGLRFGQRARAEGFCEGVDHMIGHGQ